MKTSNVRKMLADAMKKATEGKLPVEDGKNIIGLANQISHSMAVEVKVSTMKQSLGHETDKFGQLDVDS